jgi:hypothetical protein
MQIISSLLKHERKMTMLHLRVKKNDAPELAEHSIRSKQACEINLGFRRFTTQPIYSRYYPVRMHNLYIKNEIYMYIY